MNAKKNVNFNKSLAALRKNIHGLYLKLMEKVEPMEVEIVNKEKLNFLEEQYFSKNFPVSFVANHTNSHDIPVAAKAIQKHFYIVIAREGLTLIQKIAFLLNGPIFISRKDKESREITQKKIILTQKEGYSTLIYPEGSWNTRDNMLMNKLFNGAINASKESNIPIIPLIFEYVDNKCLVKVGDPFIVDKVIDSRKQSDDLRDIMCTMRNDLLADKTNYFPEREILKRIEIIADNWDKLSENEKKELFNLYDQLKNIKNTVKVNFEKTIDNNWNECPGLDREFEDTCVYKDEASPDEVFEHLDRLQDNPKAKFLYNSNIFGYRK